MKKTIIFIVLLIIPLLSMSEVYVLLYHRFNDERYPTTNTKTQDLTTHIKYILENGYRILSPEEFLLYIQGEINIDKGVLFTVDDGYKSTLEGFKVFEEYEIPFLLFVSTEFIGYPDYLSWDDLRSLNENPLVTIGGHSHSHGNFLETLRINGKEKTIEIFEEDLKKMFDKFEKELNFRPDLYAYPYGYYFSGVEEVLKKHGIKAAFAQDSGPYVKEYGNYFIPREALLQDWASLEHLNYVLNRRALILGNYEPQEVKVNTEIQIKAVTKNINPKRPTVYITQEGVLPTSLDENIIYSEKKILPNTKTVNRIAIFARDENNIEYVKYWLLRLIP